MKEEKNLDKIVIFILIISIFTISVVKSNNENKTINVSADLEKKLEWGIKRNKDHEQPDVGKENRRILEENGGICLGNSEKKYIYLTFDEGYEAGYTSKILDTLKENNVKATFFITAHYLNTQEDLVKKMIDEGHIIGNHTPISLMPGGIV